MASVTFSFHSPPEQSKEVSLQNVESFYVDFQGIIRKVWGDFHEIFLNKKCQIKFMQYLCHYWEYEKVLRYGTNAFVVTR